MKLISWNVNGLRACIQKGFLDFFHETDADIFCIQESKLQEGQIDLPLPGYFSLLELCQEKRLFRHSDFHKKRASECDLRYRHRRTRQRRTCHHLRIP